MINEKEMQLRDQTGFGVDILSLVTGIRTMHVK